MFHPRAQTVRPSYVDTVPGTIDYIYNKPDKRFILSGLAGFSMEGTTTAGAFFYPQFWATAHFKPIKYVCLNASISHQLNGSWRRQEIQDTREYEIGARVYLLNFERTVSKGFVATHKMWKYEFLAPLQKSFSLGFLGTVRRGNQIFNTGTFDATAVRFVEQGSSKEQFLSNIAIPYSYSEVTAGITLNTVMWSKFKINLPSDKKRTKRFKTFCEYRLEFMYQSEFNVDTVIFYRPPNTSYTVKNMQVNVLETRNWGWRCVGFWRRKWIGITLEVGSKPGVYYRFTENTKRSFVDQTYLRFGLGLGWM